MSLNQSQLKMMPFSGQDGSIHSLNQKIAKGNKNAVFKNRCRKFVEEHCRLLLKLFERRSLSGELPHSEGHGRVISE